MASRPDENEYPKVEGQEVGEVVRMPTRYIILLVRDDTPLMVAATLMTRPRLVTSEVWLLFFDGA